VIGLALAAPLSQLALLLCSAKMAGVLAKDQSQSVDISAPTPLRRRRAASPDSVQPGGTPIGTPAVARGAVAGTAVPGKTSAPLVAEARGRGRRVAPFIAVVVAVLVGLIVVGFLAPDDEKQEAVPKTKPIVAKAPAPSPPPAKSLEERVASALLCPGPRADIVDILAGAPYEFFRRVPDGTPMSKEYQDAFEMLPQLVSRVTTEKEPASSVTRAETELQKTVLGLVATGGGWPANLRQRLLETLDRPCQVDCSGVNGAAVPTTNAATLEVDLANTSPGASKLEGTSGWLHSVFLEAGASTGFQFLQQRANFYKSRPASVVVSTEPIVPRECFALRGDASVAMRLAGTSRSAVIRHIVIEQLPHWVAPKLWTLPGHFEVWGEPAGSAGDSAPGADPYTVSLGSFEYVAAAPAPQAFELPNAVPLRGIRLHFRERASGPESYFCIYRIRAFEANAPSCTEATGKAPARLAVPLQG